ncbi:ABC-type transport system involved in cytochrome bd biosynthesis, ATpase and permease component [Clostridium aceticum]|uniref:ABC-type transport system involved in cytochrome bd biosynthesis, ATpase and permease component n=1 Tax=Clostridium aceticum TaxID=84022 RepID=A0A0D8IB69_9CLOT|nr:ABC transporter ATP-binding protein [Clostridium aceticum]AKL96567.1 ABC-type transport system involved in cytochrome bd biosynthesis, ATpase and permease component [Clostridium aceticum]KJF27277.1 ABC transporter ATP-binding protein [Clostridium aceticum]
MFLLKEVKYKDILNIESLSIKKHKTTCIVGESGSGKTTLLRLLNKLISYDRGEIFYNNQPLSDIDSIKLRRDVVMLPQAPAIFSGSIKDNLLIGLKFSERPLASDNQLYEVLKLVKLNKELSQDTEKLSGGEKQRVALARVILMNPEVLLLDEPSSALDEDTEHIIIESLVNYTKESDKTLIMVTHSKKVASQFADEIIEIKQGKIINGKGV